jgi:hypothetical protein
VNIGEYQILSVVYSRYQASLVVITETWQHGKNSMVLRLDRQQLLVLWDICGEHNAEWLCHHSSELQDLFFERTGVTEDAMVLCGEFYHFEHEGYDYILRLLGGSSCSDYAVA